MFRQLCMIVVARWNYHKSITFFSFSSGNYFSHISWTQMHINALCRQSFEHPFVAPIEQICFKYSPSQIKFKKWSHKTQLGEVMKRLASRKATLKDLKHLKCQCGIEGKYSPVCYVHEWDPLQEFLESKKKPVYFKTFPETGSEIQSAIWMPRLLSTS